MNKERIAALIDECVAYIDSGSDQKNSDDTLSLLNVRVYDTPPGAHDGGSHSRSASLVTPSVGVRSTAPEPPSPSAYQFDPQNIKPIRESTDAFPSTFPDSTSPTQNGATDTATATPTALATATPTAAATANGHDEHGARETDDEEDLDSDIDDDAESSKGKKKKKEKIGPTDEKILKENAREAHLIPSYYTLCVDSRPFGVALCKKFDENYLCVALPESPGGQLGLRNGSQILGIDQFIIDSNDYVLCNKKFPSFAHSWFYMMGFEKVGWLKAHLPIMFFYKFDPLEVLAQGSKKGCKDGEQGRGAGEEECDFWRQMQDDIYRWAIAKKPEYWTVAAESVDVMSMPPIESRGVQTRLEQRYRYLKDKDLAKRKPDWEKRNGREESEPKQSAFSADVLDQEIVQCDEEYKRVGTLGRGVVLNVYAKAGAWLQVRAPISGWVKFYDAKTDCTLAEKRGNPTSAERETVGEEESPKLAFDKIIAYGDSGADSISKNPNDYWTNKQGDFTMHIQSRYFKNDRQYDNLRSAETIQGEMAKESSKESEANGNAKGNGNGDENDESTENDGGGNSDDSNTDGKKDDAEDKKEEKSSAESSRNGNDAGATKDGTDGSYWLSDIILKHGGKGSAKQSVIYFMGDLDFGSTMETIDAHLSKLQKLQRRYGNDRVNWIVIKVCNINGLHSEYALKPVEFKTDDSICHNLTGFLVGRVPINILKLYGLNRYDTGFFKFGLLMTQGSGDIVVYPTQSVDTAIDSIGKHINP